MRAARAIVKGETFHVVTLLRQGRRRRRTRQSRTDDEDRVLTLVVGRDELGVEFKFLPLLFERAGGAHGRRARGMGTSVPTGGAAGGGVMIMGAGAGAAATTGVSAMASGTGAATAIRAGPAVASSVKRIGGAVSSKAAGAGGRGRRRGRVEDAERDVRFWVS